jgi:hypothetical protein
MKKLFSFFMILAMVVVMSASAFAWEKVNITGAGFDSMDDFRDKTVEFLETINEAGITLDWSNVEVSIGTTIPPGGLTIGEDDSGFDVQFFGATSGSYFLWDESEDEVVLVGDIDQTGNFVITGDITSTGNITQTGNMDVTGNFDVDGDAEIATGGTLNVVDVGGFEIAGTSVTSSAAELNIMTGVTATAAELNILDTVTADATELNQLDGITGLVNVYQETVDCSGGGTGTVEELVTLPAGSVLLNVIALVTETFDGDATTTFEVGVATNYDNYIDTVDLGSTADTYVDMISGTNNDNNAVEVMTAETTIAAEWTNTAAMSAGAVTVTILYY